MVAVALAWGWTGFAALLALGFHGAMRPGELIDLRVDSVLLPEDLMHAAPHGFVVRNSTLELALRCSPRICLAQNSSMSLARVPVFHPI